MQRAVDGRTETDRRTWDGQRETGERRKGQRQEITSMDRKTEGRGTDRRMDEGMDRGTEDHSEGQKNVGW